MSAVADLCIAAWGKYSTNGTQVLFDTTIDQSCPATSTANQCFLTLHDSDGYGYNGWGSPLATVGYLQVTFNGRGTEKGILPVQYADPKPSTYIYPPAPTATSTSASTLSLTSAAASIETAGQTTGSQVPAATATSSTVLAGESKSSTSKGVIAGVSVGASLVFLLLVLGLFFVFRKKSKRGPEYPDSTNIVPAHEKLASDVALIERYATSSSPSSPSVPSFLETQVAPNITPEGLRDFIAAASVDRRTIMDPPATLLFPGDEPSALIYNIWDALAVRETYVSRLSPSLTIPTMLESLRKQANEIAERTLVSPPVMLAATSTQWKGDTVGWSEAYRFKHTFTFSGGAGGVTKKRLVVRRGESVGDGKKFETHERWAVINCAECQCYLGTPPAVAAMTVFVKDGSEVEACGSCQSLVNSFKKLHSIESVDTNALMTETESKRAELARQAVEREWERMEEEYKTREKGLSILEEGDASFKK
jgi:hypothetical protein